MSNMDRIWDISKSFHLRSQTSLSVEMKKRPGAANGKGRCGIQPVVVPCLFPYGASKNGGVMGLTKVTLELVYPPLRIAGRCTEFANQDVPATS